MFRGFYLSYKEFEIKNIGIVDEIKDTHPIPLLNMIRNKYLSLWFYGTFKIVLQNNVGTGGVIVSRNTPV